MSKVDAVSTKRVTSDWGRAFPGFSQWRPLRLVRRVGPVVQGITLDVSTAGDSYFPTAHVHALTREFPVVTMTMSHRLQGSSGVQESIRFAQHDEVCQDAFRRISVQSPLSLGDPPSIEEIVGEYHRFARAQAEDGLPPAVIEVEDSILIPAVVGRLDLTERGFSLAEELSAIWPTSRLPLSWAGRDGWLQGLRRVAGDAKTLQLIVDGQIGKHKLAKVKSCPL
ncbi:hypothetical protein GCM10009541_20660 [Micromonospora gifhornensis]|uniref:Uncharacterized protein n=1 Tax=Micromonospora gifhornensis TaxID=84594 RepID=A0ABQ4I8Z8_9ACTN|nr:hypothetical protein [Micromonospora gifhornensis]GIJ14380.1 hypothetical protein Vgi01_10640 [Micromonospora gifhornensis]